MTHHQTSNPGKPPSALQAAAEVGRQDVCAWLLAHLWGWHLRAAAAAARHGHVGLLHWLLQRRPPGPPPPAAFVDDGAAAAAVGGHTSRPARLQAAGELLAAVAWGCPLAELRRCYQGEGLEGPGGLLQQPGVGVDEDEAAVRAAQQRLRDTVLAAAAASPLPDWRAKAQWLLAPPRCHPITWGTLCAVVAAARSDEAAAERLAFLWRHWQQDAPCGGWDRDVAALAVAAIRRGFVQALGWVLREGVGQPAAAGEQQKGQQEEQQPQALAAEEVVASAVAHNQVACLQVRVREHWLGAAHGLRPGCGRTVYARTRVVKTCQLFPIACPALPLSPPACATHCPAINVCGAGMRLCRRWRRRAWTCRAPCGWVWRLGGPTSCSGR